MSRLDLKVVAEDGTDNYRVGKKTFCTTGLTTGCIHDTAVCQTGCQTGLTTGCIM